MTTDHPQPDPQSEPENPRQRFLLDLAGVGAAATQLKLALDGIVANGQLPASASLEVRSLALAAHDIKIALLKLQAAAREILNAVEAAPSGAAETARLH